MRYESRILQVFCAWYSNPFFPFRIWCNFFFLYIYTRLKASLWCNLIKDWKFYNSSDSKANEKYVKQVCETNGIEKKRNSEKHTTHVYLYGINVGRWFHFIYLFSLGICCYGCHAIKNWNLIILNNDCVWCLLLSAPLPLSYWTIFFSLCAFREENKYDAIEKQTQREKIP